MKYLLVLSLAFLAVSCLQAQTPQRIYQIVCKNYYCGAGLKDCVNAKCYGPQCPACMAINFPVCSACTDALDDKENYEDLAGVPHLLCDAAHPIQQTACDFTCRKRFRPSGECTSVLGLPVCVCRPLNTTSIVTIPPPSTTLQPVTTTTSPLTSTTTAPANPNYGRLEANLTGHTGTVWSLAVLPGGQLISGSSDKTIRVWNPATGKQDNTLLKHSSSVYALVSLPGDRFASASADKTIIIWDAKKFSYLYTLQGHTGSVKALAVLSNGDLASASDDKTIRIWNLEDYTTEKILTGHNMSITSLVALDDSLLASGSEDGSILLWNSDREKAFARLDSDSRGQVFALNRLQNGRLAAGYFDNSIVRIWNPETLRNEGNLVGHEYPVVSFANLANGDFASGSSDKLIHIRDRDTYGLKHVLDGSQDTVNALTLLQDGRLASASGKVISIWNTV